MPWIRRFSPVKSSTRRWISEARRTPNYSFWDWLHGYVYARWPYLYIGIGTGQHRLARIVGPIGGRLLSLLPHHPGDKPSGQAFADTYHGKAVPLATAKQLVTVNRDIRIENLEHVIPYERARDLILHDPQHIAVLDCPCRAVRPSPCLPLDVCLIVGEPFASFVVDHHPRRARWITPDEACAILEAEDRRGHVHHAFFKDAMLNRFYAICNCCDCCCGAMYAHRHGTPMVCSSGYVSSAALERCRGCGACISSCQFHALALQEGHIAVDRAACMGCGVCIAHCPRGALSLERAPDRGTPLEMADVIRDA